MGFNHDARLWYIGGTPRESADNRIRDTEGIAWLMDYARAIEWKAGQRKDADASAAKKTTDQP
jgi:hypothetical protein